MSAGSQRFPRIFKRFGPQIWYFFVIPLFFLLFVFIYMPRQYMEILNNPGQNFEHYISMLSLLSFVTILPIRLLFYFMRKKMSIDIWWYMVWCLGEMMLVSLVQALYLYYSLDRTYSYFTLFYRLGLSFFLIALFAYLIVTLSLIIYNYNRFSDLEDHASMMRFLDENGRLKLVVSSTAILYLHAEENYVRIYYMEGEKIKNYLLRNSMKGLEELCSGNGLKRCHRSYYVNPLHVDVLRKDKDGVVYAQLAGSSDMAVPVSRTYYDALSASII